VHAITAEVLSGEALAAKVAEAVTCQILIGNRDWKSSALHRTYSGGAALLTESGAWSHCLKVKQRRAGSPR